MKTEIVKAFFMAEEFSKMVRGRGIGNDEVAGLVLGDRLNLPVVGKNVAVAFLRLGPEAVKWYHPSGGIYNPEAKLFVVPKPSTGQICVGCDWGIVVKEDDNGKDLEDLYESQACPRVFVSRRVKEEFLESIKLYGYDLTEESSTARMEVLRSMSVLQRLDSSVP